MTTTQTELIPPVTDLSAVIDDTNELHVHDAAREELVSVLSPIALRINAATMWASSLTVSTPQEAAQASATLAKVKADAETAETSLREFDGGLIARLKALHSGPRGWTKLIAAFVDPLDAAYKKAKKVISDYQEAEKAKAKAEEDRLNAIEQERARKERERQDALAKAQRDKEELARKAEQEARDQADEAKNAEERKKLLAEAERNRKVADAAAIKAESREDQAAAVIPTVIRVALPAAAVRTQRRWKVTAADLKAAGIAESLLGYFTVENHPDGSFKSATLSATKLASAKAANSMLEIAGIKFSQVTV